MGIKTLRLKRTLSALLALKNLPTTWGLRRSSCCYRHHGLTSEKPPHHMGIKTQSVQQCYITVCPLKNLPTTWGLRHCL